jgi:1-acyl-sn-glycerol-3-phosphate acyltransferase
MMTLLRPARLIACLALFALFIAQSLLIGFALRRAEEVTRQRAVLSVMRRTARRLLAVLGVRVTRGATRDAPDFACLTVSNHQSYLDVLVIAAHYPARFVAKREVEAWPVIGLMARLCGTIFIDRDSLRQGALCAREVAASLGAGVGVQVFPEGTSTDGRGVLPFKPLLLSAALKARSPLLPLTINYVAANGKPPNAAARDVCCWHGEMEFVSHF